MKFKRSDIQLLTPDVERDAEFAHAWLTRPEGRATLLSMGNAEHEIKEMTLEDHRQIMQEFLDFEREGKQVTRVIVADNKTIGVVWVGLYENHGVKAPSIHIMIGDPEYRGKGIGRIAMESMIDYARNSLKCKTMYTRHLANNVLVAKLNEALGFVKDGETYKDENGLEWQNIKCELRAESSGLGPII